MLQIAPRHTKELILIFGLSHVCRAHVVRQCGSMPTCIILLTSWGNALSCFPARPQNQRAWRQGKPGFPTRPARDKSQMTTHPKYCMIKRSSRRAVVGVVASEQQPTLHGCGSTPYVSSIWAFCRKFRSDVSGVCPLRGNDNTPNIRTGEHNKRHGTFMKQKQKEHFQKFYILSICGILNYLQKGTRELWKISYYTGVVFLFFLVDVVDIRKISHRGSKSDKCLKKVNYLNLHWQIWYLIVKWFDTGEENICH